VEALVHGIAFGRCFFFASWQDAFSVLSTYLLEHQLFHDLIEWSLCSFFGILQKQKSALVLKMQTANFGRLSAILDEFADETGVFGLNLLRSRLSRVEFAFWIICTSFFTYCTIRDLTSVSHSFLDQDTLSLTSQITNVTIFLDPTFDLHQEFGKFNFQGLPSDVDLKKIIDNFTVWFRNYTDETPSRTMEPVIFELTATMLFLITGGENALSADCCNSTLE